MIEHLLSPCISQRFLSDKRYSDGHLRVVNALPERRVLGLHIPDIKGVAARIMKDEGCAIIDEFEHFDATGFSHEEIMVWGFLINLEKCSVEKRFERLAKFVPVMDNWAVCDSFCANAKWAAKVDKRVLWAHLQGWFSSSREFEVRFALVMSMTYLMSAEWIDAVFDRIAGLDYARITSKYVFQRGKPIQPQMGVVAGQSPYYVRMAVAWLLATALYKFPEPTRRFLSAPHLPDDVLRMYVRKAKDSFRTRSMSAF